MPGDVRVRTATAGNRVLAYAYSSLHRQRAAYRWVADCSVYVAEGHRGRGVGRMLYEALIADVHALGYVSLLAGITLPNPASVALHGSLGFRPAGLLRQVGFKHGAWHDVEWWQLLLSDPPAAPVEPAEWAVPIPR